MSAKEKHHGNNISFVSSVRLINYRFNCLGSVSMFYIQISSEEVEQGNFSWNLCHTDSICKQRWTFLVQYVCMSVLSSNIRKIKMDFQLILPKWKEFVFFLLVCHPSSVRCHWLSSLPETQLLLLLVFISVHTTSKISPDLCAAGSVL